MVAFAVERVNQPQDAAGRRRGRRGRWPSGAIARAPVRTRPIGPQSSSRKLPNSDRPSARRPPLAAAGSSDFLRIGTSPDQIGVISLGRALLCSTPFGITEYIGVSRCESGSTGTSAQRLSASGSISVVAAGVLDQVAKCSTPFGITEYIGQPGDRHQARDAEVLNAFRHHGVYRTRFVLSIASICRRAQRLSASRSISDGISRTGTRPPPRVLNAFRHHGVYRVHGTARRAF